MFQPLCSWLVREKILNMDTPDHTRLYKQASLLYLYVLSTPSSLSSSQSMNEWVQGKTK